MVGPAARVDVTPARSRSARNSLVAITAFMSPEEALSRRAAGARVQLCGAIAQCPVVAEQQCSAGVQQVDANRSHHSPAGDGTMTLNRRGFAKSLAGVVGTLAAGAESSATPAPRQAAASPALARAQSRLSP